jgi:hypothetical protein
MIMVRLQFSQRYNTSGKSLDVTAEIDFVTQMNTNSIQRIPVWAASNLVGIKAKSGLFKGTISCQVAVVDTSGKPVPGASVKIGAFERKVTQ